MQALFSGHSALSETLTVSKTGDRTIYYTQQIYTTVCEVNLEDTSVALRAQLVSN